MWIVVEEKDKEQVKHGMLNCYKCYGEKLGKKEGARTGVGGLQF